MNRNLNLDGIRHLALDVWEDLGRTRLAGVAVGLSLALLAVTVIVFRPPGASEASTDYTTSISVDPGKEVSFSVPGDKPMKLSDIDLSAPRDPFQSVGASGSQTLLPAGETVQDAITSSAPTSAPTSLGQGEVASSGESAAAPLEPIDDLSGGTSAPATPKAEVTPAGESHEPAAAPVTDYSYAADIEFGRLDDLARYASVQRLGLIPSRRLPLLMYLGVTTDHKTAVFMVDSRLSQGGEGKCVPKASLCTFLELRATPEQDEHHFRDANGNEYLLRLRGLVRTTGASGSLSGRDVSALRGTPPVVDGSR